MSELKPCPCGATPTRLVLVSVCARGADNGEDDQWTYRGNCCGSWLIHFDLPFSADESAEGWAVTMWNGAPRAGA